MQSRGIAQVPQQACRNGIELRAVAEAEIVKQASDRCRHVRGFVICESAPLIGTGGCHAHGDRLLHNAFLQAQRRSRLSMIRRLMALARL